MPTIMETLVKKVNELYDPVLNGLSHQVESWKEINDFLHGKPIIYVVITDNRRYMKIGSTIKYKNRLSSLKTSCPYDLDLLFAYKALFDVDLESGIQKALKKYHKKGEWYYVTPEAISILKRIKYGLLKNDIILDSLDLPVKTGRLQATDGNKD